MTTYATPAQIRALWMGSEQLPSDEVIQAWIEQAEALIMIEVPTLIDRLTDDLDGSWAKRTAFVETQMILNVMRNPDGVRQRTQTAGAYTASTTFGSETITQLLDLTPAHRAILAGGGNRHVGIDMTEEEPRFLLENAWVNGPNQFAPGSS